MKSRWCGLAVLSFALAGCAATSGAIGPQGYEQSVVKYQVGYLDASQQAFLPNDWALDNYAFSKHDGWKEKTGEQYRATRALDENGDGDISTGEVHKENIFDLRFVNLRDGAVIWLKVHPLAFSDSQRDLEVILDNYADGLAGTGLFEQSTLFGLKTEHTRHYTTFIEKKEGANIGSLGAILGVIEIAEVEKLRLDSTHRDSKAELLFAKVRYQQRVEWGDVKSSRWPVKATQGKNYEIRTGLLVIGYYDSASRFDSHLADFNGLISRVQIPEEALPPDNARPQIHDAPKGHPLTEPSGSPTPNKAPEPAAAPLETAPAPTPTAPAPAPAAAN